MHPPRIRHLSSDHDPDLYAAADLLAARNISLHVVVLFGFPFTQTPFGDLLDDEYVKAGVTATRLAANTYGLTYHCVAGSST